MLLLNVAAEQSLLEYSISQWRQRPEMRIEDAYKWIFHAKLGGEHAVTDDSGPRQWLDREWESLGPPKPHEREVEQLSPDGTIVRLNLRPYKARGGDKEMLLAVFVASAREFRAKKSGFIEEWQKLGRFPRAKPIGKFSYSGWKTLDQTCRKEGYPAIDHSSVYEHLYQPAYRVVLRSIIP